MGARLSPPGLPDNRGVLAVTLHPQQIGRVGHVLYNQAGSLPVLVQLSEGLAGVASGVQLCGLCNGEGVIVGLYEAWLCVKVYSPAIFQPVYLQLQISVCHCIAPECCCVPRLNLVRLGSLSNVGLFFHNQFSLRIVLSKSIGCITKIVSIINILDIFYYQAASSLEPEECPDIVVASHGGCVGARPSV